MHENPEQLKVRKATLWLSFKFKSYITKRMRSSYHRSKVTLRISAISEKFLVKHRDKLKSKSGLKIRQKQLNKYSQLIASRKFKMRHMAWKRVDITKAIGQWFAKNSSEKLYLIIDCSDCGTLIEPKAAFSAVKPSLASEISDKYIRKRRNHRNKPFRPFIVIETEVMPSRNIKKRAVECDGSVTRCCKQTLYVNFKELNWDDWIISPSGYHANYCMGSCSHKGLSLDSYINYHSYIMDEYRVHNPYASIKPCCAPRKLSPISLIYYDKEYNIIKTDLKDMSVDECGCT